MAIEAETETTPTLAEMLSDLESMACDLCDGARLVKLATIGVRGGKDDADEVMEPDEAIGWAAVRLEKDADALLSLLTEASSAFRKLQSASVKGAAA